LLSGATGAGVREALRALAELIGERPVTDKAKEQEKGAAESAPWDEIEATPEPRP